jgi:hypothetical protein
VREGGSKEESELVRVEGKEEGMEAVVINAKQDTKITDLPDHSLRLSNDCWRESTYLPS